MGSGSIWFHDSVYGTVSLEHTRPSASTGRIEAKDSVTSIHFSKHEILVGYVYNNSYTISLPSLHVMCLFQLVTVEDQLMAERQGDKTSIFANCILIPLDVCGSHAHTLKTENICTSHPGKHLALYQLHVYVSNLHVHSNFKTPIKQ